MSTHPSSKPNPRPIAPARRLRRIRALAAPVALAGLLVACSGGSTGGTGTSPSPTGSPTATGASPSPTEAPTATPDGEASAADAFVALEGYDYLALPEAFVEMTIEEDSPLGAQAAIVDFEMRSVIHEDDREPAGFVISAVFDPAHESFPSEETFFEEFTEDAVNVEQVEIAGRSVVYAEQGLDIEGADPFSSMGYVNGASAVGVIGSDRATVEGLTQGLIEGEGSPAEPVTELPPIDAETVLAEVPGYGYAPIEADIEASARQDFESDPAVAAVFQGFAMRYVTQGDQPIAVVLVMVVDPGVAGLPFFQQGLLGELGPDVETLTLAGEPVFHVTDAEGTESFVWEIGGAYVFLSGGTDRPALEAFATGLIEAAG